MPTFQRFEDKTASAYYAPGAETELIKIYVPANETFVLTHFGNEVNDARAWGEARWDIFADGVNVRNFSPIYDQMGTANQMREIPFGFITAQRELSIIVKNEGSANTYKILATLKGAFLKND